MRIVIVADVGDRAMCSALGENANSDWSGLVYLYRIADRQFCKLGNYKSLADG
jgi:hypothetical protein